MDGKGTEFQFFFFFAATNQLQLTEEMLGSQLKAGISQYLAIEMTRREGQDHRAVTKYLPWLYSVRSLKVLEIFPVHKSLRTASQPKLNN